MNKKFFTSIFVTLGVMTMLTACSKDDYEQSSQYSKTNGISFAVSQKDIENSRATAVTSANFYNKSLVPSMKVWGYFALDAIKDDGIFPGGQYIGEYGQPIIIDNLSNGSIANWQYNDIDDLAYWPSQPLNFYAVIGAEDNKVVTRMSSTVGANKLAHVVADVTIPTDNAAQKDIMFAKSVNQTREFNEHGTDPVNLEFIHALSQVVFEGKCNDPSFYADIKSITICNADNKGRVGYLTDNGSDVVLGAELAATRGYGKFAAGLIASATLNGTEKKITAKNLTAADGALMMLPQTGATKWATVPGTPVSIAAADAAHQTYLKISCKFLCNDTYIVGNASSYGDMYIPFEIDWEQGKNYTYTLSFDEDMKCYDINGNLIDIPVENGHEYVDLGLPSGLKWATCNVGAGKPEDAGLYFAWGETVGYAGDAGHDFSWANYKWSVAGSSSNFSKYNSTGATLDLEDDAAHVNLGGSWRMPTDAEIDELINNTTRTWTTNYEGTGKAGCIVKSKTNSNQIFMPAAGYCEGSTLYDFGSNGNYWSSSLIIYGYLLYFGSDFFFGLDGDRNYGFSVRGVCE